MRFSATALTSLVIGSRFPAILFALAAGAPGAIAQGLDLPENPLCRPCEAATGSYRDAWSALDAKLKLLEKEEKELKELLGPASDSRRRHILDGDNKHPDYRKILDKLDAEIKRISDRLDALSERRTKAYQEVEARQIAVAVCIKRKCYMGAEGPAPSTPMGEAEKCRQCTPLANRVALLSYRLGELNELDRILVTDKWHGESRKSFTKQQREAGREMSIALDGARKAAQKELEACRARTKDKCEGLDPCVIGTWQSEPVTNVGQKSTGGGGIVLTIKTDGATDIDYTKMKPMPASSIAGSPAANLWQGTASGRIETSDGKVSVASVEKSDVSSKITDPQGKVTTNRLGGLGPVLPSGAAVSYSCEKATFKIKSYGYEFTFKRAP